MNAISLIHRADEVLERLTDGWRTRDTNPKRKRGKNEREIPRLRFGLAWAESALVCNPIVKRSKVYDDDPRRNLRDSRVSRLTVMSRTFLIG